MEWLEYINSEFLRIANATLSDDFSLEKIGGYTSIVYDTVIVLSPTETTIDDFWGFAMHRRSDSSIDNIELHKP